MRGRSSRQEDNDPLLQLYLEIGAAVITVSATDYMARDLL